METVYDIAVIGSGPGGHACALKAAEFGLKVCCIDKESAFGGTCLHVGCIPSKTLLHATEVYESFCKVPWIEKNDKGIVLTTLMDKKREVIQGLTQGLEGLITSHKIEKITGRASFIDNNTLDVVLPSGKHQKVHAQHIVIATGSFPLSLPFLPFDEKKVVSSTQALSLTNIPQSFLVIGGGVIGVELASVYSRMGSKVTIVELLPALCSGIDNSLQKGLHRTLIKQGIEIKTSTKVVAAQESKKGVELTIEGDDGKKENLSADVVLVSIGRKPQSDALGLEKIGIAVNKKGFIEVDGCFQTTFPNIFAVGDVIEGAMLAHRASEEGVRVAEFLRGTITPLQYIAVPSVIYTHPEVASVGFTEEELIAKNIPISIGTAYLKANGRARASFQDEGFIKVIADAATKRLLGVHIFTPNASEMIACAALALSQKLSLKDITSLPFAHPTISEAFKEACLQVK